MSQAYSGFTKADWDEYLRSMRRFRATPPTGRRSNSGVSAGNQQRSQR